MRLPVSAPFPPYLCIPGSEGEKTTASPLTTSGVIVPAACEPNPEPGLDAGCSPWADTEVEGNG